MGTVFSENCGRNLCPKVQRHPASLQGDDSNISLFTVRKLYLYINTTTSLNRSLYVICESSVNVTTWRVIARKSELEGSHINLRYS